MLAATQADGATLVAGVELLQVDIMSLFKFTVYDPFIRLYSFTING